jgi:alkylation response protein AidB-like acyl-CoA dehydrogenase
MISGMGERAGPRPVRELAAMAIGRNDKGELDDDILRGQIAAYEIDEIAFKCVVERAGDLAKAKQVHPAFSSALKYYGTELNKRRAELTMSGLGSDGLEWESQRSLNGAAPRAWLRTKANSIEGGTSEVQLNIVAKRILGLPGVS